MEQSTPYDGGGGQEYKAHIDTGSSHIVPRVVKFSVWQKKQQKKRRDIYIDNKWLAFKLCGGKHINGKELFIIIIIMLNYCKP